MQNCLFCLKAKFRETITLFREVTKHVSFRVSRNTKQNEFRGQPYKQTNKISKLFKQINKVLINYDTPDL
jgi:hypothetical protein